MREGGAPVTPPDSPDASANDAAVDPVCGMTVDPDSAANSARYEGETYYFCNPRCQEKFEADPASYLAEEDEGPSDADEATDRREARDDARIYTCPMHPEVRQEGPGDCPKCGMDLEPAEEEASG
jgi:Cu+-exporting ATPase